jgi:hypothetical protein
MQGWVPTGNLNTRREGHTATLLPNGTVLVHGGIIHSGESATPLSTAELFDPRAGTWTPTGGSFYERSDHTAILLHNGKVLVVGGSGLADTPATSAELYDPTTGEFYATGKLNAPRAIPVGTLLSDGRVLVVGGALSPGPDYGSAEIYDPVTQVWTPTGRTVYQRRPGTLSLLMDGRVLAVGGGGVEAQLYDPATGSWTLTDSLRYVPDNNTATRLEDGTVLVVGGRGYSPRPQPHNTSVNNVELYDPTAEAWSLVGNLNVGRYSHTATLLPNGRVLVVGGMHCDDTGAYVPLKSTELYDPTPRTWHLADDLGTGRFYHTETLLRVRHPERPGQFMVLVAGGDDAPHVGDFDSLSSAELFSGGPPTRV